MNVHVLKKVKKNTAVLSFTVTLIIISAVFFVPFQQAEAISISTTGLNDKSVIKGDTITFTFSVSWLTGERVPIYPALELDLNSAGTWSYYGYFDVNGVINSQNPTGMISNVAVSNGPEGWADGAFSSYGYDSSGYSYGYSSVTPIQYSLTIDTSTLSAGTYQARALIYTETWPGSIGQASSRVFGETGAIEFTVNSFSLSKSPTSISIDQGSSGDSVISVTSDGSGTVNLSASGLSPGVTASFSSSSVSPSGGAASSTLTLTASSTANVGVATVTVTGTVGSVTQSTTIPLTVTAAADAVAVSTSGISSTPAPAAEVDAPTSSTIEANPAEAASDLLAASPSASAASLIEVSPEVASEVIETMGDLDASQTADVVAQMVITDPVETTAIIELLVDSNPETVALIIENLVVNYPSQASIVLNSMNVPARASLILAIFTSPNTPSKAADALSLLSTSNAAETINELIAKGKAVMVTDMFDYLSTTDLNRIFGSLPDVTKAILLPYINAGALSRIQSQLIPGAILGTATNTVSLEAGETAVLDQTLLTGVTLQITAKTALTGSVTTEYYLSNPQALALRPDWLDMRRFVDVSTTIPDDQISEIKLSIHYGDAEMYRMIESTLAVYKYDSELNVWAPLETTLDTTSNRVSIILPSLSLFGVGGVDP